MSIDLTRKVTVATFVDTIVAEAGTYLGHNMIRTVSKADPTLRPYTRNLAPVFLASMTSFTQLFSREKEKPEKERGKK